MLREVTDRAPGQAVLIAVGIDWDGRRQILAVEMASRESRSAWRDFLVGLKALGLKGVEFVVSDDHAGLVKAIGEILPEAAWQRCYVPSCATRSTISRASMPTTAFRSCAGSATAAISPKPGPTSLHGWQNGHRAIRA